MKNLLLAAAFAASTGAASLHAAPDPVAQAAPLPVTLSGETSYDEWTLAGITNPPLTGYPSVPGTGNWPAPIQSNVGGDAFLEKTANGTGGGPYPASSSIYFGGFSGAINNYGGELTITDSSPILDLNTVVFQLEIGEAWGYDFYNRELPTLSFNGGSQNLTATFSRKIVKAFNGTVEVPTGTEDVFINLWGLQWDLSSIDEPITSFSISFKGIQHAMVYGLRLDTSSAVYDTSILPVAPVPEPETYAFLMAALCFFLIVLRRRAAHRI